MERHKDQNIYKLVWRVILQLILIKKVGFCGLVYWLKDREQWRALVRTVGKRIVKLSL
jgi:hypothetical protein